MHPGTRTLRVGPALALAACATAGSPDVETGLSGEPRPAGTLRVEILRSPGPEGPVVFSLSDAAHVVVLDVAPGRIPFVLFPAPSDGRSTDLSAGKHAVGRARRKPDRRRSGSQECRPEAQRIYQLVVASRAPLRLDRLRLRPDFTEDRYRVTALSPGLPTEMAVQRLLHLVGSGEEAASDVAAYLPAACEPFRTPPPDPVGRPPRTPLDL